MNGSSALLRQEAVHVSKAVDTAFRVAMEILLDELVDLPEARQDKATGAALLDLARRLVEFDARVLAGAVDTSPDGALAADERRRVRAHALAGARKIRDVLDEMLPREERALAAMDVH